MEKIGKVWFSDTRIFMQTVSGNTYSRPLEAFPLLKDASDSDRKKYIIWNSGTALRWKKLDEDIHISSFFEEEEPVKNEIGDFFSTHPQINVSSFAKQIGINKSLMAKYIYGIKTPSEKRKKEIQNGLHQLARNLNRVRFVSEAVSV